MTIYKQSIATSINQAEIDDNHLKIYPNPSNGLINIELKESKSAKISVFDISGKLVYSKIMAKNSEQIDLSAFSGILIVKVDASGFTATKQLIINK